MTTGRREGEGGNVYSKILERIFAIHYTPGGDSFEFRREAITESASELGLAAPKNVGDVIYAFRYRNEMPESIAKTARDGFEWIIEGAGIGRYVMRQAPISRIAPRTDLLAVKIPDSTPEIISAYAQSDEQALLATVRYNRLVDIFLGVTAYSLQNHLRTTVQELGQIEIDEIYVAVDRSGTHFVVPVQAKSGNDRHSVVQTRQDILCCSERFEHLVCRAVSAQFVGNGVIAMFELTLQEGEVRVVSEKHYQLTPADAITTSDLEMYRRNM